MYDLRISKEGIESDPVKVLRMLYRFGYRSIAITDTIDGTTQTQKIKSCPINASTYHDIVRKVIDDKTQNPTPVLVQRTKPASWDHVFQILTRVHIILDQKTQVFFSSNPTFLNSYDIISVEPTTEKLFQNACSNWSDIDIISLDMTSRLPFLLRYPTVNAAIQRGIMFELTYSASLRDPSARKHFISNAANLFRVTKGKNIILSSGARSALEIRAPYDVMNLASLFSMGQNLAKESLTTRPQSVITHAASRKDTYRCVISIEQSLNAEDGKRKASEENAEDGEKSGPAKKQIKLE